MKSTFLPPTGQIENWTLPIPPAYVKALKYIQDIVINTPRGEINWDEQEEKWTVYLKIEPEDVVEHPVLMNVTELWLSAYGALSQKGMS